MSDLGLATLLLVIGCPLLALGARGTIEAYRRSHERLWGYERVHGHLRHRQRLYGLAVRNPQSLEVVLPAEHMRGWVWIRVQGRLPQGTELPIEAHEEQMGWAPTRRAALRALGRETGRDRDEAGEVTDMVLFVVGVMVVAAVASRIATDVTPGDVLDWMISKAAALLDAARSALT